MGIRELFFPKKRDFFKMLRDHAAKTEEGMQALHEFVKNPTPDTGKRVDDLEEEADALRKYLIEELNESFMTPIDREDIFALARAVDDMVDYAKSTVEEMTLFKVGRSEHLLTITDALMKAAHEITEAVGALEKRPLHAQEHVVKARKTENFIEHRYREALAELFNSQDTMNALKVREVYRHLSNAADRAATAAAIISDIIVKVT